MLGLELADHRVQPTSRRTTVSRKNPFHLRTLFAGGGMALVFGEPQSNFLIEGLLARLPGRKNPLIFLTFLEEHRKSTTPDFDCLCHSSMGWMGWRVRCLVLT